MPTVITRGAASAQGYGFAARSTAANYIEDVFSTYLYTGTGSTQTITNGIDLSGKGGMVWLKGRSGATNHALYDTARGATFDLVSNTADAQTTQSTGLTSFGSTGFSIGALAKLNTSAATYASWTFRKQAKFFDVVTWTGNGGTSGRTISHNLGSVPGCIIVKNTTSAEDWYVYPASLGNTGTKQYFLILNSTAAQDTGGNGIEKASNWTSTQFALASGGSALNGSGQTYVAYLFAHNAGGFGAAGTDNVISCGSYTGNGSATGPTVTLGYEPQWLLVKRATTSTGNWTLFDSMRGFGMTPNAILLPNSSAAESAVYTFVSPSATGFQVVTTSTDFNSSGDTYIYIAIRRGPMKTPTSGTSVFSPVAYTGTDVSNVLTTNINSDAAWFKTRGITETRGVYDKLRGRTQSLYFDSIAAEDTNTGGATSDLVSFNNNSVTVGSGSVTGINNSPQTYVLWALTRAPGFFDVVCYTGTGSSPQTINHNLGVAPQLIISRRRSPGGAWWVGTNFTSTQHMYLQLNDTAAGTTVDYSSASTWVSNPGASSYAVGATLGTSSNPYNWVSYLFATVAGVSKVGSYTGTGTTKQIDCGFTGGARFVLIKRTDSTGDWYVWDTARGIVAGNDPYLRLNSTGAEVTNTDYVDTYSAGFEISSTAPAAINANGGSFIFLAIA